MAYDFGMKYNILRRLRQSGFKVTVVNVPAKKARKGIDPFTKQERKFAAKPATTKVKVRAMKKLKDAAL